MRLLLLVVMLGLAQARNTPETGEGRQKRFVDYVGAWKGLFKMFPPSVRAVQENAELRMQVETERLKTLEHPDRPAIPLHDPYQTNFNPGGQVLYMSMSKSPMEIVPAAHNAAPVYKESVPEQSFNNKPVHRRSADVQFYDPSQRSSLLGKVGASSTVTHYAKVKGGSAKTVEIPTEPRVSKRSAKDMMLDDPELADMIIEEANTPQEALARMINAEKAIDSALHKVMGDLHQSDSKDVRNLEKIIDSASLSSRHLSKRSIKSNVEKAIRDSSDHIAKAHNLLEMTDKEDRALEEVIKADKQLSALLEMVLTPQQIEVSTNARSKRDHQAQYYDSDLQWLINDFGLNQEEGDQVKKIVYGESSVDEPQFYQPVSYSNGEQYYTRPPVHQNQAPVHQNQAPVHQSQAPVQYVKYGQRAVPHTPQYTPQHTSQYTPQYAPQYTPQSSHVYYPNEGRQNKMDEKSTFQTFLDTLRPIGDAVPDEINAAYRGALEVGKHVTKQVRPYAYQGYDMVTKEFIPQATTFVSENIGDDLKDFARQGRKIVETRAKYASEVANPHLESLKDDLWLLQEQLKQVAAETNQYAKKEIYPNIGHKLQGLIFDVQETLELANQMVINDVKPLAETSYSTVASSVVYPAASKVNDYVVRPVTDSVNSYVVNPVSDYVVEPVSRTASPVYHTAHRLASSGVDSARVTYQKYEPTLNQLSASTQKVWKEDVGPRVAVGASKIGDIIQSDLMPNVQYGVSTTLDGLFTGIPSLINQVSSGANDAAKIFSNRYKQALDEIKTKAAIKKKEQEAQLNMIHKEMELMKAAQNAAMKEMNIDMDDQDMKEYDAVVQAFVEDVKALEDEPNEATEVNDTTEPVTEQIEVTTQTQKAESVQATTPKEL
jgi:hypothetical protein